MILYKEAHVVGMRHGTSRGQSRQASRERVRKVHRAYVESRRIARIKVWKKNSKSVNPGAEAEVDTMNPYGVSNAIRKIWRGNQTVISARKFRGRGRAFGNW